MSIRYDWSLEELQEMYSQPLFELVARAHQVHQRFHPLAEIQVCALISIKTGGCPEDCKYCSQSARYQTAISAQPMMEYAAVLEQARQAVEKGATRICLGAAWRGVRDNKQFDAVLQMVEGIRALGVEVCCTLGLLNEMQAERLREAGLYAYNHNLDTSERFYKTIITTRSYQERLETMDIVERAGLSLCCGGIIGMGEEPLDRLQLLLTLAQREPHHESLPINRLAAIPGTPLADRPPIALWEQLRFIALARIVLPATMIRLSAGRLDLSLEGQALCFFAGANSIFFGEKLLTVGNVSIDRDEEMFRILGLKKQAAYTETTSKIGNLTRRDALNLGQSKTAPKKLNLNKLSDAGWPQSQGFSTPSKPNF